MGRKKLGFLAFVLTGVGLILSTVLKEANIQMAIPVLAIAGLFGIGLIDHYKELQK